MNVRGYVRHGLTHVPATPGALEHALSLKQAFYIVGRTVCGLNVKLDLQNYRQKTNYGAITCIECASRWNPAEACP